MEEIRAFDDIVKLIRALMGMDSLVLIGLEVIVVTEKVIGLEQIVLLHLLGRKKGMVGDLFIL